MTRYRWVVFLVFTFVFSITGLVLILYAQGYRYHFGRKEVEKTGEVSIESKPRGAIVSANGETTRLVTPARISAVLSGQYTIGLFKDGYYPWNRSVHVDSGRAAIIHDATLIKNVPAEPRVHFSKEVTRLAALDTELYAASDHELFVIEPGSLESRSVLRTGDAFVEMIETTDSGAIFLATRGAAWLVTSGGKTASIPLPSNEVVRYRFSQDGDAVLAFGKKSLFELRKEDRPRTLLQWSLVDAMSDGTDLYFIRESDPEIVYLQRTVGKRTERTALFRAPAPLARINAIGRDRNLIVSDSRELFVVNLSNRDRVVRSIRGAAGVTFISHSAIVSWNDFEIFRTDGTEGRDLETTLIDRMSTPLTSVFFMPKLGYLLLTREDGTVSLVESADPNTQNRYSLASRESRISAVTAFGEKGLAWLRSDHGSTLKVLEVRHLAD